MSFDLHVASSEALDKTSEPAKIHARDKTETGLLPMKLYTLSSWLRHAVFVRGVQSVQSRAENGTVGRQVRDSEEQSNWKREVIPPHPQQTTRLSLELLKQYLEYIVLKWLELLTSIFSFREQSTPSILYRDIDVMRHQIRF